MDSLALAETVCICCRRVACRASIAAPTLALLDSVTDWCLQNYGCSCFQYSVVNLIVGTSGPLPETHCSVGGRALHFLQAVRVLAVVFDIGSLCYNEVTDVALHMLVSLNAGGPYLYYLLYMRLNAVVCAD